MGKRILVLSVALLLLVSILISGCQPAPAPAPTPSPAPAPASVAQPIKLKWSHGVPPGTVFQKDAFEPWAKTIKDRTTAIGKPVEITFYPGGALAKLYEQYNLLVSGGADIVSNWGPAHFPGRMPLSEVLDLPLLFSSSAQAGLVAQELFQMRPEIQKEFSEAKVIGFHPTAPSQLNSREKQIKTFEDMKGLKTHVRGGPDANMVKALGAVPVSMPMPEVYEALQRGVVDVGFLNWEGISSFKWFEATKARTQLPKGLYINSILVSMNWNTYKNLPPDVQKIFDEVSGLYLTKLSTEAMDKADSQNLATIIANDKKVGNPELYVMPADEFQKWINAETPLYETWIKDTSAKGLPAQSIFDDVQRLTKKYAK
jgi:TRAP-type C4-dicarboxylate transport system substrate-binding protein